MTQRVSRRGADAETEAAGQQRAGRRAPTHEHGAEPQPLAERRRVDQQRRKVCVRVDCVVVCVCVFSTRSHRESVVCLRDVFTSPVRRQLGASLLLAGLVSISIAGPAVNGG